MRSTNSVFNLRIWLTLFCLCLGGLSIAGADEALAPPQQVIQKTADQLQVSLQKPEYKANFTKATALVDQIINPHVDFDRVSIMVLGKHWRTATPAQKEQFKQQFRLLLVRTYTTAFTEYANWKIRYLPLESEGSDKRTLVKTEILPSGGEPVAVNYRMVNEGTEWKVYDILIEGISLLQNYRSSFNDEIEQSGSLDQLIAHLTERNAAAMSGVGGEAKAGL